MSKLFDIESRAVALLEAAPYFNDVIVRAQHHGDLATVISQRLAAAGLSKTDAKKPGLLVLCSLNGATTINNAKLRVKTNLTVAVIENPLVNQTAAGTGKLALAAVEEVLKTIFNAPIHANVPAITATHRFELADPAIELLTQQEKSARYGIEGGIGYHVHFTASETL
jgi:hypothetical protein